MSCLVKNESQFKLTQDNFLRIIEEIKLKLNGRVLEAYIFGSTSTESFNQDSDIDLILVVETEDTPFVQRSLKFSDLHDIYPKLDMLVYTKTELEQQLADSDIGFWKSVRLSLKKIV